MSYIFSAKSLLAIRSIRIPSSLIIGQRVSRIGNKSFDLESVLFIKNNLDPVCVSTIISVAFDFKLNQTVEVYQKIIDDYEG